MFYDADAMRCRLHTEAVAQETMRLLPVAPLQGAEPIEDTLIGDVLVPKGTPIYLLAGRAAKMAAAFSEPRAFNPQRWLSGGHHASAGTTRMPSSHSVAGRESARAATWHCLRSRSWPQCWPAISK